MEKIKKFIAGRGVGYYLSLLAVVCGMLAGILYICTGVSSFNPDLNVSALVCIWVAVVMCAVSAVFDFKDIRYVAAMLFLYGLLMYIDSQVTYIANVFVAIDGYGFTAGFLSTLIFSLLSFVVALLAGILTKWRPWAKNQVKLQEGADENI